MNSTNQVGSDLYVNIVIHIRGIDFRGNKNPMIGSVYVYFFFLQFDDRC